MMSEAESRKERQENEVNALKAIFEAELEDLRSSAANEDEGGNWQPLDLLLKLTPQQGSSGMQEVHAEVHLRVRCCPAYPDKPPQMEVKKSKGLSTADISQLMSEIKSLSVKLCGQEMVYEIAQHVQGFLHKHNKPGFKSFHEEMLQFQQQKKQQQQHLDTIRQQKERQAIQDEVHRKQVALRAEGRQRRESLRHNQDHATLQNENLGDQSPETKPTPFKDFDFKVAAETDDAEDQDQDLSYLPHETKGQSRIISEFEILKFLGKGAFGDVLKVRNKLDDRVYAIKRIELNPRNRQLNRRITREVKLLSRLNHENVVRYYNSWIESATMDMSGSETSSEATSPCKDLRPAKALEDLASPLVKGSVEWSVSSAAIQEAADIDSDSDSDSDSPDGNPWLGFLSMQDSSDCVVFENGSQVSPGANVDEVDGSNCEEDGGTESPHQREFQFMYIQMEFCEKSTLRTAIDHGLCQDEERVWRLFREIVEGLAHIHQQGMIHRDLKPVNIFLDSQDHVKIGDFGLATMNILPRSVPKEKEGPEMAAVHLVRSPVESQDMIDESLTGQVGTALYVAPEVNISSSKAIYNQKVDIYSLGIILFEMCSPPLSTGMERMKVLHNLRSRDIVLPSDFPQHEMLRQVNIIRWLLNHEPSKRPSSEELLASDLLPPPQLEDAELQDMVRHTLSNPQSKAYKYLVASCFKQEMGPADDVMFDRAVMPKGLTLQRLLVLQDLAKDTVRRVFQKHGASCLTTPLLMPHSTVDYEAEPTVKLMTRWGGVVTVPHDLRVNFARYVAWNGVTCLKRYAIQHVYRERRVFGFHPRELFECAFDIVTPSPGSLLPDAELLAVAWEVMCELPGLRDCACALRLNHTALFQAALIYSGVNEDRHPQILSLCSEARDKKSLKLDLQGVLSETEIGALFSLLEVEGPFSKVAATFRSVSKRRGQAASLAKQGLHELENTINLAQALGVKCPVIVSPALVRNVQLYSGVMCQLVCENKNKHRHGGVEVIAAGGRYDGMLTSFRQALDQAGMLRAGVTQSAAGVSICLDRVVMLLHDSGQSGGAVDVVLWPSGRDMLQEASNTAQELWAAGIKCLLLDSSQQEVDDYCQEMDVQHIVVFRESDSGSVRVRSWEKDRLHERRVLCTDLVDFLQRALRSSRDSNDSTNSIPPTQRQDSKNAAGGDPYMHSHTYSHRHVEMSTHHPFVSVNFISSERMAASTRRRYESQIHGHTLRVVQRLEPRVRIEVLAVGCLDGAAVSALAGILDMETEQEFNDSRKTATDRLPRSKKYLADVLDDIHDLRFEKNAAVIILYSLLDNKFRVLV